MVKNILLRLAYDGTDFSGYQKQAGARTVQEELQTAVEALTGRRTRLIAAGRTDAGVHADEQWVNFLSVSDIAPKGFRYHLARLLPEDILVTDSREVPLSFHSRFSARSKTYRYVVSRDAQMHPRFRHYKAKCDFPLDLSAIREALPLFEGMKDFSAFSVRDPLRGPLRRLDSFTMLEDGTDLIFHLRGESFLHHQVRILIGAMIEVGRGRLTGEEIERLLREGSPHPVAPTMPACGLTLESVELNV